ncbi:Chitin synthase, class 6 [Yamadazyma tenuis]|uniref:Uncharacterized protein n=1 Tax=Candida tenuis (strain ATCC 10573 / BCRC 21748 / CBS 615 / JCM 9827 / NBRC 10315 / NRRL Y-1498 / VKM Y-70) TaxID=590646 RepID=G3B1T7_CANTC|nr:uncharacterized protein CANTEDRAFT_103479 [Yamadazyma tenuis ATCC 10573]EGV64529.1 hypothetical protein CANTEDRAFT_103479 [Yamadazyma tenuis ATCC 10573]WEJ97294.1 Chitin synthase, class 6 [Yamadazyma tenuis]
MAEISENTDFGRSQEDFFNEPSAQRPKYGTFDEFPRLRDPSYGNVMKSRTAFQMNYVATNPIGPPDLLYYGIYAGATSYQFTHNDFNPLLNHNDKDVDGYIGYYHYVNGLDHHNSFQTIQNYVFSVMGIERTQTDYHWKHGTSHGFSFDSGKKETVVTFCSYNIFDKSEFRLRNVITPISVSRKTVSIDTSFQIASNDSPKVNAWLSIHKVPQTIWDELRCSSLIRLFCQLDDPSKQLPGLVSLNEFVSVKEQAQGSISLLIKFLSKGYLTDSDSSYGVVTGCVNDLKILVKTNVYRNRLIDTLLRLCEIGPNGGFTSFAIDEINKINANGNWDYVILMLLKLPNSRNTTNEFIELIFNHLANNELFSTQSCLMLLEQVKFLISKNDYQSALKVSATTIKILPLDFECWFYLALCYTLEEDYEQALISMNSFPMSFTDASAILVSGVTDEYSGSFVRNFNNNNEPISEKTFLKYFPQPKKYINSLIDSDNPKVEGKMKNLWEDIFIFDPNARHPIMGNDFYQSPLVVKSAKETSLVDSNLIKLVGPNSTKIRLSAYSANCSGSSILDFTRKSTWGRSYDLLSFIVAQIGWDSTVLLKSKIFEDKQKEQKPGSREFEVNNQVKSSIRCESWLEKLFMVIIQDLKILISISSSEREQNHSALEWEVLGLLGWNVKYHLKASISSLITAVMGDSGSHGFNYFGSIQVLALYDEFVLSDVNDSQIDIFTNSYNKSLFTNKLILKQNEKVFQTFTKAVETELLPLDVILLIIIKMISWNLRWYQYVPNYLINTVLAKLSIVHSPEYIISKIKIVFEQNKNHNPNDRYRFLKFMRPSSTTEEAWQFDTEDTITTYIERIINRMGTIEN